MSSLQKEVERNTSNIERNEKNQRQRNMRLYGVPFTPNEKLGDIFKEICMNGLKMSEERFNEIAIDNMHRVDRDKSGIIIAFVKRFDKNFVMSCKKSLKTYKYNDRPIFLSDDLTSDQNKDRKRRNQVYKQLIKDGKKPVCAGNFYIVLNGKKMHYSAFDAEFSDNEFDDDIDNAINRAGTSNS